MLLASEERDGLQLSILHYTVQFPMTKNCHLNCPVAKVEKVCALEWTQKIGFERR